MGRSNGSREKQHTFSIKLGNALLAEVETMRRAIQDSLPTGRTVSRGDVIRLALRRLQLAMLQHDAESSAGREQQEAISRWMLCAQEVQLDGICPDWLTPGCVFQPAKKSSKKGGKQ